MLRHSSNLPSRKSEALLVLGGNYGQLPLIEAAIAEGYRVVLVGNLRSHPGVQIADSYHCVSYYEREDAMEVARSEDASGVLSNSEFAAEEVAAIFEALGLIGNSLKVVRKLRCKPLFRSVQQDAGLYTPRIAQVGSNISKISAAIERIDFPLIVKPAESSGSRGVSVIDHGDSADVVSAVENAAHHSPIGQSVIEEYVPMPSLSTIEGEALVWGGACVWQCMFTTVRSAELPLARAKLEKEARARSKKKKHVLS